MSKDRFGNVDFEGRNKDGGLRQRYDFLMALEVQHLRETRLPDVLNWCRWGSQVSVMWEATLPELLELVKKWESVNSRIARELYGTKEFSERADPLITWEQLCRRMRAEEVTWRWQCACGEAFYKNFLQLDAECPKCHAITTTRVPWGPRGKDTYNLELLGADGYAFAEACHNSQPHERPIPQINGLWA